MFPCSWTVITAVYNNFLLTTPLSTFFTVSLPVAIAMSHNNVSCAQIDVNNLKSQIDGISKTLYCYLKHVCDFMSLHINPVMNIEYR